MTRLLARLVFALAMLTSFATFASEKPNIIVMGEDADEHTATDTVVVERDTRVFRQVLEAISDQFTAKGFAVYDERAVSLDNFKQDRVARPEAELMDIARSVQRPPLDAAVIFTIYAGARRLAYTTDVYARITARVLDVRTGQKLGSFEVASPPGWRAPASCDRDCLVEVIGRNAESMAGDLGTELASQLATRTFQPPKSTEPKTAEAATPKDAPLKSNRPTGYTLVFQGFSPEEITDVEEYLVAFQGYKLHRPVTTSPRRVQYWYEIDSDSARLNRNLRMMLDRIGAEGRLSFSSTDNTFTVEKTSKAH